MYPVGRKTLTLQNKPTRSLSPHILPLILCKNNCFRWASDNDLPKKALKKPTSFHRFRFLATPSSHIYLFHLQSTVFQFHFSSYVFQLHFIFSAYLFWWIFIKLATSCICSPIDNTVKSHAKLFFLVYSISATRFHCWSTMLGLSINQEQEHTNKVSKADVRYLRSRNSKSQARSPSRHHRVERKRCND